jgi:uncharacterized protein (TIGR02246 family)
MLETSMQPAGGLATQADETRAIRHTHAEWMRAERQRDLHTILCAVTDDVVLLRPRASPLLGRQAVEDMYRTLFAHYDMNRVATVRELRIEGDLAWLWSDEDVSLTPAAVGPVIHMAGNSLSILRRTTDGPWRWARIISNVLPVASRAQGGQP